MRPSNDPKAESRRGKRLGRSAALIPRGDAGTGTVRIATLSFTGNLHEVSWSTLDEFLRGLNAVRPQISKDTELVVCSLRRIYDVKRRGEYRELDPRRVLDASGGVPVMLECASDEGENQCLLFHRENRRNRRTQLRSHQILSRSSTTDARRARLRRALSEKAGVIHLIGAGIHFVVLICGENNALNYQGRGSVLKNGASKRSRPILGFGDPWILLNPSHKPYWPPTKRKGAQKVMAVDGHPALFTQLVMQEEFKDKTTAPVGIVHANNFVGEETIDVSSVAFSRFSKTNDRRVRCALGPLPAQFDPQTIVGWRYAEYVLQYR